MTSLLLCAGPQDDGLAVGGKGEFGAEEDLPELPEGQGGLRHEGGPRPPPLQEEESKREFTNWGQVYPLLY